MAKVYEEENKCCGCGACESLCPVNAIIMKEDEYGFIYPFIDEEKCINCDLCRQNCAFNNDGKNDIIESYAATNTDDWQKRKSSSAGIFPAIAKQFLESGGVVVGCSMVIIDGQSVTEHIIIETENQINKLQGSKYVQSTLSCYRKIEGLLKNATKVLFSGTPCQVKQIKSMFNRFEEYLYTIDIICHGVPNQRMFNEYLKVIKKKHKGDIVEFRFRDKEFGEGLTASVSFRDEKAKLKKYHFDHDHSSYYRLFLEGEIYRECCYNCPYACDNRIGDITLGDYWGAETETPFLFTDNGGIFESKQSLSCILVNTGKGKELLENTDEIKKEKVELDRIKTNNKQLNEPSQHSSSRQEIFDIFVKDGYKSVDRIMNKKLRWIRLKKKIPHRIKQIIRKQEA